MNTFNKITKGFVVQKYHRLPSGNFICLGQTFVAEDEVVYEDDNDNPIDVDHDKEVYQPFGMKDPKQVGTDGLQFTCPNCQGTHLECVMDGSHISKVLNIDPDGDFDYDEIIGNGDVVRWQCVSCGDVLNDIADEPIIDNLEIVEWVKENCSQEK